MQLNSDLKQRVIIVTKLHTYINIYVCVCMHACMKMEAVLLRAIGLSLVLLHAEAKCPQSRDIKRTRPEEFKLHDLRFS